jgi:branched-chain amino acid transport system ATP-binding protein
MPADRCPLTPRPAVPGPLIAAAADRSGTVHGADVGGQPGDTDGRGDAKAAAVAALADVPREPGAPKPDPILVADDVVRRFGGLTAVDVRHVEIQRGAITALIGPNGAGKTTFFNLLTGFDKPDSGAWTFNGQSSAASPPTRSRAAAWCGRSS